MNTRLLIPLFLLILAACAPSPALEPTLAPAHTPTSTNLPTIQPTNQSTTEPTPTPLTNLNALAATSPSPTHFPLPTPQSTNTPTPTPTTQPTNQPTPLAPLATVLQSANLRAGPGTNYAITGAISAGQEVFLKARNAAGTWIQLDMEGAGQVWIAAFLLDLPAGLDLPFAADIPPSPTPLAVAPVRFADSTITIATYPWQRFTTLSRDETYAWDYRRFDRAAYDAANPAPRPQTYRLLVLENRWLRLSFLPGLGGRVYQMIFKPTGNNELYQNPVIKPSPWGPGPQGNGWLAAGGIEWGYPVPEHGYAWGDDWGHLTLPRPPDAGLILFDRGQERLHASVEASMSADSAAFTLDILLENPTAAALPVNFWLNAMLAPGPANRAGPDLHFLFPMDQARVHSTGESDLPGEGGIFAWPVYNGRAVDRLGTWQHWLGFFAHPRAQAGWAAVYDTAADEGVIRIFPPQQVPGLKGFGFGYGDPIAPARYTDDGSSYVEMHGGLAPTFDETANLPPGSSRSWRETWYPVAGIGGITQADARGAAHLVRQDDGLHLRLFSVASLSGELTVEGAGGEMLRTLTILDPASPLDLPLPTSDGPISFHLQPASGPAWAMSGLSVSGDQ